MPGNFGKKLTLYVAKCPRRAQISSASRRRPEDTHLTLLHVKYLKSATKKKLDLLELKKKHGA